jgi:putative sigma-54 modulation protein
MQLALHAHGLSGQHHARLLGVAVQRCESALGRLAGQVTRVALRLTDENGPRGGPARRCVAELRLASGRYLVTEDRSTDWADAIGSALTRAAAATKRLVGRQRAMQRR